MINGLNKRLQSSRINCNLSRKQVAELLGVSESLIGLYENASRQPSLDTLMKLASIYRVSTDFLLGCEPADKDSLSLSGLTEQQKHALTLTAKCFRSLLP